MTDTSTADHPWWRGAVIYQVYPRSFADTTGDGVGDLPGVEAHLEHIASLGVDAVWLSPFFPSPMKDFGYDVSDYCGVDPVFGTLADFDRLVAKAHRLGLKVLIDQVYAHTSDEHDWFRDSRWDRTNARADWYVWRDARADGTPPTNWQSVFGGPAWTWDARRGQYYMHNFLGSQPQLNLHNPEVQDALLAVARFWLERGVDGFRLDAINFGMHDPEFRDNPALPEGVGKRTRPFDFQAKLYNQSHPDIPKFLSRVRALCDLYDARFTVAEVPGEDPVAEMKAFTAGETHLNSAYGFDFLYAERLTAGLVARASAVWDGSEGQGWPSWTFSNHDAPRAVSRWAEGRDETALARMALLLLVCMRGNAIVYQGEELGLPQGVVPFERLQDPEAIANWPATLGRDGARTPMPWMRDAAQAGFSTAEPWLPVDPRHVGMAADVQGADPGSTLNAARRLLKLRRTHPALRTGPMTIIEADGPLLVFERSVEGERLRCVFNLGFDALGWRAPDGWRVVEAVNADVASARLWPLAGVILSES